MRPTSARRGEASEISAPSSTRSLRRTSSGPIDSSNPTSRENQSTDQRRPRIIFTIQRFSTTMMIATTMEAPPMIRKYGRSFVSS